MLIKKIYILVLLVFAGCSAVDNDKKPGNNDVSVGYDDSIRGENIKNNVQNDAVASVLYLTGFTMIFGVEDEMSSWRFTSTVKGVLGREGLPVANMTIESFHDGDSSIIGGREAILDTAKFQSFINRIERLHVRCLRNQPVSVYGGVNHDGIRAYLLLEDIDGSYGFKWNPASRVSNELYYITTIGIIDTILEGYDSLNDFESIEAIGLIRNMIDFHRWKK